MKKFLNILFIVVVVCVIAISAYYVYKNRVSDSDSVNINNEVSENLDVENLPEGVEIVERDGERILRDQKNDFELELEDEWVVFSPSNIANISLKNDFSNIETAESFFVYRNDAESKDLKKEVDIWLEGQNRICEDCYELEEIIKYKDVDIAVVRDLVALGEYKNHLFFKNNYVYNISSVNLTLEMIKTIIDNIKFEI